MKRRRGDGKAIRIELNFSGEPDINFILQSDQSQWFKMEVEKIDFVVELLPYHLDKDKIPKNVKSIIYNFDQEITNLNNIEIDDLVNPEVNKILDQFISKDTILQNRIYFKSLINKAIKSYAG